MAAFLAELGDFGGSKSYWLDQLKGLPPLLQLPCDHPRASLQNYVGRNHSFLIPKSGLEAFCKAHHVTPSTVLFAVFSLLLSRYSRRSDICIGTLVANRNHALEMAMVGNFANTLPMRVQVHSRHTFLELLSHVHKTACDALANKDLPFEMLVEVLPSRVSQGYSPIFQIMFSYETMTPHAIFQGNDLSSHGSMKIETLLRPIAKYDLHLGICLRADGQFQVSLDYNRILFNRETMELIAGHFTQLLKNVLAQPKVAMLRIPMIPESETQSLIETNNQTSQTSVSHQTLTQRFEEWVAKRGDAIALVLESHLSQQQITYAAFNARANQWGRFLRSRGVQPGDRVAVLLDHPALLIAALLAILKIDAAYVPLDPNASPTRTNQIIEDAQPSLLLTQSHLLGEPKPILTLYIEDALASLETISTAPLPPRSAGAACVMYTSSGKGVVISDQAILNMVCDPFASQLKPGDTMAFAGNVASKTATFEIWSSLMRGCRMCCMPQSSSLGCVSFAHFLNRHAIDCVHLATEQFHFLARQKSDMLGKVRSVFFGGESADPVLINAIFETEPPQRLIHAYGSAEITAHATLFEVRHALIDDQPVPIGYPISNGAAFVVDAQLQIQPANLPGELVVGGDSLGFGYLNRPALTAATFIPNDFLSEKMPFLEPGSRLCRTGDLVRRRTDGALEFLGKIGD